MVAKDIQDKLVEIRPNIECAYDYFKHNYDRYHKFRNFVYNTTLTEEDNQNLNILQKPKLQMNILEAYVARQLGNFAKQEPGFEVSNIEDAEQPLPYPVLKFIEGHLQHELRFSNLNSFALRIFKDLITGGLAVIKVWTEYKSPDSWMQDIRFGSVFDPTLCGFDPMARAPSKNDGAFCFENFPTRLKQFKAENPGVNLDNIKNLNTNNGFQWAYNTGTEDIILQCYYYEKKYKSKKLLLLTNGKSMFQSDYDKMLNEWQQQGRLEQPPQVKDARKTKVDYICRYHLVGTEVLDYVETDFPDFPLIFVGHEEVIRKDQAGNAQQMTKPLVYHAYDAQRLMNFSGQTLANEIECMMQTKIMAPLEGIPVQDEYRAGYTNPQKQSILVYNQFKDNNPSMQVNPPSVIPRTNVPAEVMGTFQSMPTMIQHILGSYDAVQGINNRDTSGKAIINGAIQSDAATAPYLSDFMAGFNVLAQLYVDLMPMYLNPTIGTRTLTAINAKGKKSEVTLGGDGPDAVNLNYKKGSLKVKVEAGVNLDVQKNQAIEQMTALSKALPAMGELIQQHGLDVMLDNIDFRGADRLKEAAPQFMQERQQQQQQAQQMNPLMMKMQIEQAKLQQEAQASQAENAIKQQQVELEKQDIQNDTIRIMMQANAAHNENAVQMAKANAEKKKADDELEVAAHKHALALRDQIHQHKKDINSF